MTSKRLKHLVTAPLQKLYRVPADLFVLSRGHRSVLRRHRSIARQPLDLFACISAIDDRRDLTPGSENDVAPLIVLSAGWRSGSTLVQRLACSDGRRILWGEPYGDTGLLEYLSEPLRRINSTLPPSSYFFRPRQQANLSDQWIANLYPGLSDLRLAYRAFFDQLFAQPALEAGYPLWGFKEVRLEAEHARFLQWLYPQARFVLLVRNPLAAYRSYARFKRWYRIRPQRPVFNVWAFCDHWGRTAAGFRQHAAALGALLVRYEDIIQPGPALAELATFLGVEDTAPVLEGRIASHGDTDGGYRALPLEEWVLRRRLRGPAGRFGYEL